MNQNTLESLLLGISQPAIFFLPRQLFEKAIGKDLSELDSIKFTNHLIVRNKEDKYKLYSNVYDVLPLMDKKVILNSNFFEILKMREQQSDDTFKFFIDQYFAELDTWLIVAELTKNNARLQTMNYEL
tara:strand:- start:361 stop:744 length:384 start_codon:yes stop_codon:yes gene_type:complete